MYRISNLCKTFGLSRSTLLYYDSIGLLSPKARTATDYRLYSEEDMKRLEQICIYREAGIPLEQIKHLLDTGENGSLPVLTERLSAINHELHLLRLQQKIVVNMLKEQSRTDEISMFDRDTFVSILLSSGVNEQSLKLLHTELEKHSPKEHQAFLEFLGLSPEDIRYIREHANSDQSYAN